MQLELFEVIPIDSGLTVQRRKLIDAEIEKNSQAFDGKVEHKWLKRGDEKFIRLLVGPATFEIVFHDDRVELYGFAPVWARLLFTSKHRKELEQHVREFLVVAGFVKEPVATS